MVYYIRVEFRKKKMPEDLDSIESLVEIKMNACTLLEDIVLSNGEKQALGRLVALIDEILLDRIKEDVKKSKTTPHGYITIKFKEIKKSLSSSKHSFVVTIRCLLDMYIEKM